MMMLLKSCPRCRGDLNVRDDIYGAYKQCVQCGYMQDIQVSQSVAPEPAGKSRKKAA